jgi:hypothetical protein
MYKLGMVLNFTGQVNEIKNQIQGKWEWNILGSKDRNNAKFFFGVTKATEKVEGTFDCGIFAKEFWDWLRSHLQTKITDEIPQCPPPIRHSLIAQKMPMDIRESFMANPEIQFQTLDEESYTSITAPISTDTTLSLIESSESQNHKADPKIK